MRKNIKVHLQHKALDCRDMGQTEFEYNNQSLCGYVRDIVSSSVSDVTCKLCLKKIKDKEYV